MSARRLRREQARRAIRAAGRAARASGCTCDADVAIRPGAGPFPHVDVAHYPHCALLRSRDTATGGGFRQLVVALEPDDAA